MAKPLSAVANRKLPFNELTYILYTLYNIKSIVAQTPKKLCIRRSWKLLKKGLPRHDWCRGEKNLSRDFSCLSKGASRRAYKLELFQGLC